MQVPSAINDSSISLKDLRTSTTKTYSITSSTTITDNTSAATYRDIAVGDSVMVMTSSSTTATATATATATSIVLNPTMGGSPSGQTSSSTNPTAN
jgi:hypothetical protein